MSNFYTLLTTVGASKLANATALGTTVTLAQLAVGDGNGSAVTPTQSQTALVNQVRIAALNTVNTDDDNPNWIVCEQVIPAEEGGFTIREVGLFDSDGDLIAVGNFPETYKPLLSEGSGRTQTIRIVLEINATESIELKIDPSVVLATREYVDQQDADVLQQAKDYADAQDSDLKAYVDAQDKSYQTAAKSDATKKANQALTDSQTYADTQDASTLESAKSYADTQDASTLESAKSYADTQDAETLSSAEAYAANADHLTSGKVASARMVSATTSAKGAVLLATNANAEAGSGSGVVSAAQVNSFIQSSLSLNKSAQSIVTFSSNNDFAQPSGWCGFVRINNGVLDSNTVYYYKVLARRDIVGGYGAIAMDSSSGITYLIYSEASSDAPTIRQLWDSYNHVAATEAIAIAGTDTSHWMNALTTEAHFLSRIADLFANGDQYLYCHGKLIQFGTGSGAGNVTLPMTFPNSFDVVLVTNINSQGSGVDNAFGYVVDLSTFYAGTKSSSGSNTGYPYAWLAIGE